MSESMKQEAAFIAKERIIDSVEAVVGSGHYTLEEIITEVQDRLVHLEPDPSFVSEAPNDK